MKKIGIASDHAGYDLKIAIKEHLEAQGFEVEDFGCGTSSSCDYADYAHPLADAVDCAQVALGFAFCGSANGISIALNKHKSVRAAICWLPELAALAREHNDANICSIAARFVTQEVAIEIVDKFIKTPFDVDHERHSRRIAKITLEAWENRDNQNFGF